MEKDSYDRIVDAATQLFAQKGYHGTSMRDIARAVDLHVATVQQHVTSKELLYKEVFRRQYEKEYEIIQTIMSKYAGQAEKVKKEPSLLRLVLGEVWKTMFSRFAQEPHLVRLWVYRLLERDELAFEIDQKYSLSLFEIGLELIENARQSGSINPDRTMVLLWMSGFSWLHMGYFAGRNLIEDLDEGNPLSPEFLQKFYQFVDRYVDQMIDLQPDQSQK